MNIIKNLIFELRYIFLLVCSLVTISCEEVINLDLNNVTPVLTAEGLIEQDSVCWLRLGFTTDYFTTQEPLYVEDALVTLIDDMGQKDTMEYKGSGLYQGVSISGKPDRKYTINIIHHEFTYTASSKLMGPVQILSVTYGESSFQNPGSTKKTYQIRMIFSDDSRSENYYNIDFFRNGIPDEIGYTLIRDENNAFDNVIDYYPRWKTFEEGDFVTVIVYSIDKNTYTYYSQLNDIIKTGISGSSTPYNPVSNFGPSVLGYFRAYSSASCTSVVR